MGFREATTSERTAEVKVRVGKLKNRKATGKDMIGREMIKGRGDKVED